MAPRLFALLAIVLATTSSVRGQQTLDDFVSVPERVRDVKVLGLVLASQNDPKVAEHNSSELIKNFWASSPDSGVSKDARDDALRAFKSDWNNVRRVLRDRKVSVLGFAGMDLVLLSKSLNWYFAAVTPQGPVLICIAVQYNTNGPMTVHGIRIWTDWDAVKEASAAIQMKAGAKVLTVTYTRKAAPEKAPTQKDEDTRER